MSELKERRYKEVEPKETVEKLKSILNERKIEVEEICENRSSVDTYSLRICIKGTNIGQNGKGMTKEFAMASGYAEFFERLQNNLLRFRTEKPTKDLPFSSFPDEKYYTVEELMKNNNSILENIIRLNKCEDKTQEEKLEFIKSIFNIKSKLLEKEEYLSLPYYSVKNKDVEYIPEELFNYLFGTNGMCAGNSPEEALIEGLSEIIERYVGTRIFKEGLSLPEIPEYYLEKFPKVKGMLAKLRENEQYYFRLIDCSLGGKYPVAGLYVIEKNTGRYGCKLGAHPDYEIAMERCFTEAAQGRDVYEYAEACIFDFYAQGENEKKNLTKFYLSELKEIPYTIIGKEPEFEFTQMPDVSDLDNKKILEKLVNSILKENGDILIRDLSVLGFPTYSIAIPGMSEYGFDAKCEYFSLISIMQNVFKELGKINLDNISEITSMMETIVNEIGYEKLTLFINLKDISILPCEQIEMGGRYFLAIAYIMNEQYNKAVEILEELTFMADNLINNPVEKIMIKAVYYYASAMDKMKEHDKAMYYIYLLFDKEIAEAIDISFKDRNNIFVNHYGITQDDYVDNDDAYYLPYMKILREAQRDNMINQIKCKEIFE